MRSARALATVCLLVLGLAACQSSAPSSGLPPPASQMRATLGAHWLLWPDKDGCADAPRTVTLQPGTRIDRYGDEKGRFFADPGTPFGARSLPYDEGRTRYTVYVVKQPLLVERCGILPWFDEPGGGTQYKSTQPASDLVTGGVIAPQ